ncbi:spermatogenesis-associated protein 7-like isoform X1 [Solea solea]|uniref:spermatogenesis-associated protein 7-like isoform X1 n=1 Tax=Solea solea TaxID=90069 RepID=UPI00272AC81D|nr:spermatogenesis-associated protein 7-like isoform X1 [Solea solea]
MGYAECDCIMESRTGSVSSGLGSSTGRRGQTVKSSPFCPRSSSKLTQSIVRDHMVSHYKKVYSAKAAIDTSVPKSMIHSVKYNDHIRQDRFRKGGRPQSAHSLSQNNSRASCFLAQSRLSLQYEDNSYLCSRASMASSSKFRTSFHAKDVVKVEHSHHSRPASQSKSRSPESALRRKQSVCSLSASGAQSFCKTFQDPVQKTYSGDLLQKHSQHFTHGKPFTPKTLKTDKSSYLEKYRYYRAPLRKPTQDCNDHTLMQQETSDRGTKTTECTQEFDQPSQGFVTEHEWSEDESNGTYLLASRQKSRINKSRDYSFFDSSSRLKLTSPEDKKSLNRKKASAEEEELKYLEFISAVTEDILSRRHISDRVLGRVIKHHIDMNRHRLDEGKMLHLLAVLRKDFEEPTNTTTSNTELEKRESDLLDSLQPFLESGGEQVKTKEDNDVFSYVSLIKQCDSPNFTDALLVSTPVCSPDRTASPITTNGKDQESDNQEKLTSSPRLGEHLPENTGVSEEDVHQNEIGNSNTATDEEVSHENREHTSVTSDEILNQDQAEVSHDGQSQELEDLGRHLSESLHVSSNNSVNVETTNEQHVNTVASVSDDEF